MASNYFFLDGAYNEVSLCNSPDPVQDMKYPCLVSYPFLSDLSSTPNDQAHLPTHYENMTDSYKTKPCSYCHGT